MIILSCNNLNKSFGVDSILENVSFTINEGTASETVKIRQKQRKRYRQTTITWRNKTNEDE